MPNTGKPSKDCHLCRTRRVKCDLARPSCQRCIKYGADCPGYRDQQELVFRNANPTTIKKRKKRSQTGSTFDSEETVFTIASPTSTFTDYSTPSALLDEVEESCDLASTQSYILPLTGGDEPLILPKSLNQHWTAHSIPILLNVYSTLDFLHNTYRSNDEDGPLIWAAHLFSRTYVTNLQHSTAVSKDSAVKSEQEIGKYLGKTLATVHAALKTPGGAMRDDVLATVWILANYELLMGSLQRLEPLSPWHLHTRGLYSILKTRGVKWLRSDSGRAGFWPAYNMVQVQCLLTNIECPPETEEWFNVVRETMYPGEAVVLNVSMYIAQVARVQSRILTILLGRDFAAASAEYHGLVGSLDKAEADLKAYFMSRNEPIDEFDPYMLNMYHSTRVKGYHILTIFTNFLTHHIGSPISLEVLQALRKHCTEIVRSSAQEILNSLPQTLDPRAFRLNPSPKTLFDALKLIWPLTAVLVMPPTLQEQKDVAQKSLRIIGRELGVRQALKIYSFKDPFPAEARKPLDLIHKEFPDHTPVSSIRM